jgi:uncharacterized membrane protein YccC
MPIVATGWARFLSWLGGHGAELRLSLRMTVAGVLAFALADMFNLAQGYWAVLTAVIVIQASLGGSLKAGLDRLIGTLCGAAYGAVVAALVPHAQAPMQAVALVLAVAPLALVAAINASFRIAPVTAVIVLLGTTSAQASPFDSAIARVLEIGLGCVVGVGVSLLVLPARAHRLVGQAAGRALDLLADLAAVHCGGLAESGDNSAAAGLHDRLRAALATVATVAGEADRERRSRLTDEPDAEPLLRTLRRLRSALIILGRATTEPLPEPERQRLGPPLAVAGEAIGQCLRATGAALALRREPPALDAVIDAIDQYVAAMADIRRAGITRDLPGDEAGRIFAIGFALEQLRSDLHDLVSRAHDFAGTPPQPAPSRD